MEVLTLQFGHFSNHVGAHFWNFADEVAAIESQGASDAGDAGPVIDPNRLLQITDRHGWRPRLVAVDQRGALGAYHGGGVNLDVQNDACMWDYEVATHQDDLLQQHPFQLDLEKEADSWHHAAAEPWSEGDACESEVYRDSVEPAESDDDKQAGDVGLGSDSKQWVRPSVEYDFGRTVRTWTDYIKVELPNTCVQELRGWHHGVSPFAMFFDGLEIKGREDEEGVVDLVRRQAEDCDQLDGVQVLVDMCSGFGGVAELVLRWVREESPKSGKLVVGVQPMESETDTVMSQATAADSQPDPVIAAGDPSACSWVSAAFSFAGLVAAESAHAWVPVAVPLWSVQPPPYLEGLRRSSMYEAGGLVASSLETATLPCRLQGGPRPSQLFGALAPAGRPACGLLHALPVLLPPGDGGAAPALGSRAATGVAASASWVSSAQRAWYDLAATPALPGNAYTSVVLRGAGPRALLGLCEALPPRARALSFAHAAPLPLPVPFPQVFSPCVSSRGVVMTSDTCQGTSAPSARPPGGEVEECSAATQVHAAAYSGRCSALQLMAHTLRAKRRSGWASVVCARYGVEVDEFTEVLEVVNDHLECSAAVGDDDDVDADSD